MSFNEIAVIAVCLLVGYWLASKFMEVKKDERAREEKYRNGGFSDSDKNGSHDDGPKTNQNSRSNESAGNFSDQTNSFECSKEYLRSNWHNILGVPNTASMQEISAAYKAKIRQYHPDKCSSLGQELKDLAEKKAKQINAAYEFGCSLRQA